MIARRHLSLALLLLLAMVGLGYAAVGIAQVDGGQRSASPADSSSSFEVGGIQVDVSAKNATAARYAGWRLAQRKGWQMLAQRLGGRGMASDSTLDSVVSGIVVENEQIGPTRYIARLGVMFDRGRAASILGVSAGVRRSPPLLVIPIQWSGGVATVFERRSAWQEAWARYRTGNSSIDYVRPSGTGPDPLLMNLGQISRPGRGWWRTVTGQYGAADVLIPIVHLYREWPGGPVIGAFQARFGPDNRLLTQFSLRVSNADALPALLDAGIKRIDDAYQSALANGVLRVDPGISYRPPAAILEELPAEAVAPEGGETVATDQASSVVVQFDTPGAASVASTEAMLRGIPGVSSAVTTSLALGGISVMRVGYGGDISALKSALEARGWQVTMGSGALRIHRPAAPPGGAIPAPADNATQG